MQFYKSLNTDIFFRKTYSSLMMTFFITLLCYSLQIAYVQAKTTQTIASGVWGDVTKWSNGLPATGDSVVINHVMDFTNVNLNIGANTVYTFAPGSNGSAVPLALSMSTGIPFGATLNVNANVSFAGGINLNGGTINVLEGATLTVTNQINQAGTKINVESGANFNITGSYINNGGDIHVDGLVAITGTYDGQNVAATVTGSGDITTTGHMNGINQSTIFGIINPSCGGPCSGRNLCGRTVTSTPAASTYCTTGTLIPVVLTGNYSSGSSPAYQWQASLSNTEAGFSNIAGATNATYPASPLVTTYYRVKIKIGNCTSLTPVSLVTSSTCNKIWVGGASGGITNWNVAANWSPSGVPSSFDDVTIPNVTNKPVIASSKDAKSITINANSSLTLAANSTLNSYGNIVNNGTFTAASTATVVFKGSALQTIYGIQALNNVTVDNASAGISILTPLTVKGTLTLKGGVVTTNSNLTINFDNGGNIAYNATDAGSINGDVTGRRDGLTRTHYIAAPFNGVTSAQVGATTPLYNNNYWKMYSRDFATQGWLAITNTTTALTQGTGYSIAYSSSGSLILTGGYSHSYTLPAVNYSNAAAGKYIMVGNPYPSTLDWTSSGFTKTNVGGAIYLWSGTTSQTSSWVGGTGTGPNGSQYIGPMQAFLVATTGSGGNSSVAISNTARLSTQNPSFARVASDETVRIKLTTADPNLWDDAVVRFNETATADFDEELDAYKILNQGFAPSVYTTSGTDKYSINSIADAASVPTIPVAVKLPADGNYTISVAKSDAALDYILVDKKLGTENLISGPAYAFSGSTADDVNRFELQLRTAVTTGTRAANAAAGLQINSSAKGFVIQTTQFSGSIAEIEILDVTGKSVKLISDKNLSGNTTFVPLDLAEGAYIVKVRIDNTIFAQMISLVK